MKNKITLIIISVFVSMMLITSGYGKWKRELKINGNIKVVPDPTVLSEMYKQLDELQIQLKDQIVFEEQQRILIEQQKLLEQNSSELNTELINGEIIKDVNENQDTINQNNIAPFDNSEEVNNDNKDQKQEHISNMPEETNNESSEYSNEPVKTNDDIKANNESDITENE